jgi:hypothetical protein
VVYFRSLERNVGLPFAFFLEKRKKKRQQSWRCAFGPACPSTITRYIFFFSSSYAAVRVPCVCVCVCGAVWSIRWNDDGRRGGGGAVYLFPLNSNLNDWWELIAWQWERDETRPLLPLNIVAGSPISGDPPLLSFTTLNHRVPPPPLSYMFSLNSWSSLSWGPEPRY